ncbi:hypothetical protein SMACR_00518 [Sordaria macrospora]|uniref:WGS project CABT00000000 data, contig 2.1 n=2 Tax=Sordaria macrospora TaxID=5147 RepID=F7VLC4_SORMK|nr:uncharacterized protein SMAC_00518 [Sordaria macrospora k-hell]KAA8635422.1 hypothetical protein SMACR_00518 [Sordaria macrospora]KAH7627515.1 NADP-dependent oxidoreductase domain-containing protein [Sordaria sp. MPI-SDFR-AT-0083]WPJ59269.1 hypothetical protein SMAC4_00518 [Sordaria macrospora]CCC06301.1 unnamed protein product [Sordaria macrospora k-hell]
MPQLVGKQVGPTGYGLMGFCTKNPPTPQEQAFKAMRAALESGANFWNAGEFYGSPDWNTQKLLAAYFKQYPEDAEKVVLSVKGAFLFPQMIPDCSPAGLKRSIDACLADLDGTHKIDIFEPARVDPKVPLEETLKFLEDEYVSKGVIGGIGLSEVSAATIRKAVKITKIAAVEVEISLWATHTLENGVAEACAEFGIPLIAYSPIGQGMLTGQIKTLDDLAADDFRRHYPRFYPENFHLNIQLVSELNELAKKKGFTPAQLAINWVKALSKKAGYPTVIPIPGATTAERVKENNVDVELTSEDLAKIDETLKKFEISGRRYPDAVPIDT